MQFKGGYISDAINKIVKNHQASLDQASVSQRDEALKIKGLMQYASSFDVAFPFKHDSFRTEINPILSVLQNIVSRGLPTRTPILLEQVFEDIGLVQRIKNSSEIKFQLLEAEYTFDDVFKLLHFIEPGLLIDLENYGGELGSHLEWQFISQHPILIQVLEAQRDFSTISSNLQGGRSVDFSFVSPYLYWNEKEKREQRKGCIVEVDGNHHTASDVIYYDQYRDENSILSDFETLRLNTVEVFRSKEKFEQLIGKENIQIFEENFGNDIAEKLDLYTQVLTPLAVGRIHKTLIELFISDTDLFKKEKIKIAIIERDLPCAGIAIKSLVEQFQNLNQLVKSQSQLILPEIELDIFDNKKWVLSEKLHCGYDVKNQSDFKEKTYDIILDHSILKRVNVFIEKNFVAEKAVLIRSAHYCDTSQRTSRKFYCSRLLEYNELVIKRDDGSFIPKMKFESSIKFFLQNIFRKIDFREGQLPIISRALQNKPVIGLLPTGGGKSITYQLPVLLQPGLTLIVDPIKSLMEDQVRVLKENLIDGCEYINSNLNRSQRDNILLNFRNGECLFLFVSPERFVMSDFRSMIQNIDSNRYKLAFSYCVIDEVHCVSEWGHDFRSTYLMLGINAQKYAKTKSKPVTILGLTATASFDVLTDIERELQIEADDIADSIIMIENTIRPELFFKVIDVTDLNRIETLNEKFLQLPATLNQLNQNDILERSLIHHYSEFESDIDQNDLPNLVQNSIDQIKLDLDLEKINSDDLSSIVFCLVKGDKKNEKGEFLNQSGVRYIHESLKSSSKGYFYGSENEDEKDDTIAFFNEFVNGNLQHIVCTKAFGMGIDKSDIRATFHYNFPNSFESLVQEAGRAGRNKKVALANILFSKEHSYQFNFKILQEGYDYEKNNVIFSNTIHRKSLRKVFRNNFINELDAKSELESILMELKKFENYKSVPLTEGDKEIIRRRFSENIVTSFIDRGTLDYFFNNNFKGKDVEYSQIYSLFHDREFEISKRLAELTKEFNSLNSSEFTLKYWSSQKYNRIYVSDITEKQFGYIELNSKRVIANNNGAKDIIEKILSFLNSSVGNDSNLIQEIRLTVITELNDDILSNIFRSNIDGEFEFIITSEKIFPDNYVLMYYQLLKKTSQINAKVQFEKAIIDFQNRNSSFEQLFIEKGGYLKFRVSGFDRFSIKKVDQHYSRLFELYQSSDASEFVKEVFAFQIELAKKNSQDFTDFLLLLEEHFNKLEFDLEEDFELIQELKRYYYRSRNFKPTNDTGRLIYRMHSMGLLKDYTIDYNKNNLYHCTLVKYSDISIYVGIIQEYLKRYLSENSAKRKIEILIASLTYDDLVEDVITCLNFLADFSFEEIASKRKRATDEIENALVSAIKFKDDFTQNIYLKEQIYFYFNAKYARIGFKIEGEPYSLTDDFKAEVLDKRELLFKYLNVFQKDKGSEQNNYKHMIGSCKKILRSLVKSDFEKDWMLRLIKAFAMYAVNNPSYISEANEDLEKGFENLYLDTNTHQDNFTIIYGIFKAYKEILEKNIYRENKSFFDIQLILMNILIKLQSRGIEKLILTNTHLVNNHA